MGKQSTGTILSTSPKSFEDSKKTACDCRNACSEESRCHSWDYRALGEHSECTLRAGNLLEDAKDEHMIAGLSGLFSYVPSKDGFKKCAARGKKCACSGFARFGGELARGQFAFTPAMKVDSDVQCEEKNFEKKLITKFGKNPFCECKHSELADKFKIPSTSDLFAAFATDEQRYKNILQIYREYPLGVFHALEVPAVEMGIKSAKSCDAMKEPAFQQSGSPFMCGAPLSLDMSFIVNGLENVGLDIVSNALRSIIGNDEALGTDEFFGVADMCLGSFSMQSPAHRLLDSKCRTDIFDERKVAGTFSTHVTSVVGVDLCVTVDPCDGGFYFQATNDWIASWFIGVPTSIYKAVIVAVATGSEMGFGVSPNKNFKREFTYWTGDSMHEGRVTDVYKGRFALNFQMDIGEGIQGLIQHTIFKAAAQAAKNSFVSSDSSWVFSQGVTLAAGATANELASRFAERKGWPILNDAFGTSKAELMLGLDFIDELVKPDFGRWFEEGEGTMMEKVMWLVAQNSALVTLEAGFELNFKQLTRGKLDFVLPLADAKVQMLMDGVGRRIHFAAQLRSNFIRQLCNLVAKLFPNMGDLGKAENEKTEFQRSKGKNSFQCPDWLEVFDLDVKIDVLLKVVGDEDETFQVGFRVVIENEHVKRHAGRLESCLETEFVCNMFFSKRNPFAIRCNLFGNGVGTNDKGAAYQITETAEVSEKVSGRRNLATKDILNKFGECGLAVQQIMNDWLIRKPVKKIKAILAVANERADEFIDDIGELGNFLQFVGARDDNGIVYAVGNGLKKTSEALTIVKGMAEEAVENFREECDKRFDRVEEQCREKADDFGRKCDQCERDAQKCKERMERTKDECENRWDICKGCRKTCENVQNTACDWGNVLHEDVLTDTVWAGFIADCNTKYVLSKSACWVPGIPCYDKDRCIRESNEYRDREKRKHREGHKRCREDARRKCMRSNTCSLIERIFEDHNGDCNQICDIAFNKVTKKFGCKIIGQNVCQLANCGAKWFTLGACDTLESFGEICERDERVERAKRRMLEDFSA